MINAKITKTGSYVPPKTIINEKLESKLNLENGYIEKRTGIQERRYIENETIEQLAIEAVKNINLSEKEKQEIGLIIVATTSTNNLMPGIANYIQKELQIKPCICLDILAGCSGFINALDISKLYIENGRIEKAIVVGVDTLSKYTDKNDVGTSIILSDGAGAILLEKTNECKKYKSNIIADGQNNEILTCKSNKKIQMDGKKVYKYATTETVQNVKDLLEKDNINVRDVKYFVLHQSNKKIMKSIATKLNIEKKQLYTNIETKGNTFCASIPILLDDMMKNNLLQDNDTIVLLGYGGGMNTGSILIEI